MVRTAPGPEAIVTGEPTRLDLLRFAYAEVLDATKHQDDKVGRLLGAVAFLTGGALVFADRSVLQADVRFLDDVTPYPLGAVMLGLFLIVDLVAVASFMIAMSAPLTLPRSPSGKKTSHIYFRSIAGMSEAEWARHWSDEGLRSIEAELQAEIVNIAVRADRKFGRTTIATNLFLAALAVLAPTVVVGLAAVVRGAGDLPWDTPLRWCVAGSLAAVALSLLVPLAFRAADARVAARSVPFWFLAFVYPALLAGIVVAPDGDELGRSGALPIVVLGVVAVALVAATFHRWPRILLHAAGVAGVAGGGVAAWAYDRPDAQLYVAIAGCVVIVVPNIVDELRHLPRPEPEPDPEHPAGHDPEHPAGHDPEHPAGPDPEHPAGPDEEHPAGHEPGHQPGTGDETTDAPDGDGR